MLVVLLLLAFLLRLWHFMLMMSSLPLLVSGVTAVACIPVVAGIAAISAVTFVPDVLIIAGLLAVADIPDVVGLMLLLAFVPAVNYILAVAGVLAIASVRVDPGVPNFSCARNYRHSFRENKSNTLVFND
jgi:hypothetical protein